VPRREVTEPDNRGEAGERFLLWIDGVGGFLVCLGRRVTLGQATPDAYVDVPLFADVSRVHAALTRDSEGYVLEGLRPLLVNGQSADRLLLQSGDRMTLGSTCQIQFRQPVPVSASARLDLVSGHRLALAVDGVLLMADTLVLGPGPQAHVIMPELNEAVVLYRHREGLGVRYGGNLCVDGQRCRERGLLRSASTVTGDDFAFAVEPVGTGTGRL
jgi:FHA domain